MSILESAGMLVPDVFEIGGRVYAGQNQDTRQHNVRTTVVKPPRRKRLPGSFIKQENAMSQTADQAEIQAALDGELAKFVDACPTPERKVEMLVKIGFYREELRKQSDMLSQVDDDLAMEVAEDWFKQGDELLKRAIWNSMAGSEEIPLRKQAPISEPEIALGKMLDAAPNDSARALLLHKIGSYTTEVHQMLDYLQGRSDADVEVAVTAWLTADPGETPLKKNILDAEMPKSGKRIYAQGVQAGDVVDEVIGNASSHAGAKMGGSETNSDQAIRRTVPRRPTGEGSGKRVEGSRGMPAQADAGTPNPGSGTVGPDGGSKNVKPETVIRRKGATGGLGSVAGAEGGEGGEATVSNDDTHGERQWGADGKRKKTMPKNMLKPTRKPSEAEKAEFVTDLLKIAPEAMIEAILELPEDDQEAAAGVAANHASDLLAWSGMLPQDGLAKRDLDASVAEWLNEDPDQVQLKLWVAEALATAEEIPLELAKAIMAWQPPPRVTVRREAA